MPPIPQFKNERFFLTVLTIVCTTFLTAIGKMTSEDCQIIVIIILGINGGWKAYRKWREKKDLQEKDF